MIDDTEHYTHLFRSQFIQSIMCAMSSAAVVQLINIRHLVPSGASLYLLYDNIFAFYLFFTFIVLSSIHSRSKFSIEQFKVLRKIFTCTSRPFGTELAFDQFPCI